MKTSFIHAKEDNKHTLIKYLLFLIPLVLYGIYKNGILLYQKEFISLLNVFKSLYLIIISIIVNGIVEYLFEKKIKLDFSYLNVIILSLFVMPSINLFIYTIFLLIGLILSKLLNKKVNLNTIAFTKLLIVIAVLIFGGYTYSNLAEANNIYAYNLLDIICGRNTGGIASTNMLLGIIIYALLSILTNYKKNIPFYCYISYLLLSLLIMVITHNFDYNIVFSSTVIMSFIFVAPETTSSPYTRVGQLIYGIFIGLITAIVSIWLPYEGVFIAILFASLGIDIFDRIGRKVKKSKI